MKPISHTHAHIHTHTHTHQCSQIFRLCLEVKSKDTNWDILAVKCGKTSESFVVYFVELFAHIIPDVSNNIQIQRSSCLRGRKPVNVNKTAETPMFKKKKKKKKKRRIFGHTSTWKHGNTGQLVHHFGLE